MNPTEIDIFRAAAVLIEQHGMEAAKPLAVRKADDQLLRGDVASASMWRRIAKAIEQLEDVQRNSGAIH
jgi:hypothetical protein